MTASPVRPLTPTQARVAQLVARGKTYQEIGADLNISPRTAEHHVYDIANLLPDDGLPQYRRVQRWASQTGRAA